MAKKHKKSQKTKKPTTPQKQTMPTTDESVHKTKVRVIGVGGGAGSIISEISADLTKIDFVSANTDAQALKTAKKKVKTLQFGQNFTNGLGCGMDPKVGQKSAVEAKPKIAQLLKDIDLAIFVACLGGGTGSGAAPEFIKTAKELGVMSFGIFTTPFKFEGAKRAQIAKASLARLTPHLNGFSVILNENIFKIIDKDTPIVDAFSAVNKRLSENLRGLIEMIYVPGIVNIDFADLKTILEGKGKLTYLNTAYGQGENRAESSVKELVNSPLSEYGIGGAEKIIFNITASENLAMKEMEAISNAISNFNRRAKIIFGVSQDNSYNDKLRITLLAVGVGKENLVKNKIRSLVERKPEPKKDEGAEPPKKPAQKPAKNSPKPQIKTIKRPAKKKRKKLPAPQKPKTELPAETVKENILARKNALDLKKEEEQTGKDLLDSEEKWTIPAFLRRENDL